MNSKWIILAAALVTFIALGAAVSWHNSWLESVDGAVLKKAVDLRTPELTAFMKSASILGTGLVYLILVAVGLTLVKHTGWQIMVVALISLALAQLVRLLINLMLHRPRPPHIYWLVNANWFSFPSGHTVAAAVSLGLAAWLIWTTSHNAGVIAMVVAVALAILVASSRVYLGVHWASDVVGGLAFALAWLMLTILVAARIIAV